MGLYDNLIIDDEIDLPEFEEDTLDLGWQTKDIQRPIMQTFRLTKRGRLMRKEKTFRPKTDEEKQEEAEERGFDSWDEMVQIYEEVLEDSEQPIMDLSDAGFDGFGSPDEQQVDEIFWLDHNMHGSFEFHTHTDDYWYSYEAWFEDGELQKIILMKKEESDAGGIESDPDL